MDMQPANLCTNQNHYCCNMNRKPSLLTNVVLLLLFIIFPLLFLHYKLSSSSNASSTSCSGCTVNYTKSMLCCGGVEVPEVIHFTSMTVTNLVTECFVAD